MRVWILTYIVVASSSSFEDKLETLSSFISSDGCIKKDIDLVEMNHKLMKVAKSMSEDSDPLLLAALTRANAAGKVHNELKLRTSQGPDHDAALDHIDFTVSESVQGILNSLVAILGEGGTIRDKAIQLETNLSKCQKMILSKQLERIRQIKADKSFNKVDAEISKVRDIQGFANAIDNYEDLESNNVKTVGFHTLEEITEYVRWTNNLPNKINSILSPNNKRDEAFAKVYHKKNIYVQLIHSRLSVIEKLFGLDESHPIVEFTARHFGFLSMAIEYFREKLSHRRLGKSWEYADAFRVCLAAAETEWLSYLTKTLKTWKGGITDVQLPQGFIEAINALNKLSAETAGLAKTVNEDADYARAISAVLLPVSVVSSLFSAALYAFEATLGISGATSNSLTIANYSVSGLSLIVSLLHARYKSSALLIKKVNLNKQWAADLYALPNLKYAPFIAPQPEGPKDLTNFYLSLAAGGVAVAILAFCLGRQSNART